ncbi:MAG: RluA family pseudouridine synthase [Reyranellaceae bacterium]
MPSATEIQSRVLYRDKLLLVLDKPAGLAVHRGPKTPASLEQLLPHLQFGYKELPQLGHRLDRDTSGCLVLGRNRRALRRLGELFAENRIGKTYWAIVEGGPPAGSGVIDMALLKVTGRQGWRILPDPTGQPATTDYRVRGAAGGRSWLELSPRTGRTHQIRIHCAELGFPVVGDPIYGPSKTPGEPLMLHARSVSLPFFDAQPPTVVTAPPPDHMREPLKAMGWDGSI